MEHKIEAWAGRNAAGGDKGSGAAENASPHPPFPPAPTAQPSIPNFPKKKKFVMSRHSSPFLKISVALKYML